MYKQRDFMLRRKGEFYLFETRTLAVADTHGLFLCRYILGWHIRVRLSTRNIFIEITATDLTKAHIALDTITAICSVYCKKQFTFARSSSFYYTVSLLHSHLRVHTFAVHTFAVHTLCFLFRVEPVEIVNEITGTTMLTPVSSFLFLIHTTHAGFLNENL